MNILIIGLGSIAAKHIDAIYQLNKSAQIYALRSNSTIKSEIAGITNVYSLGEVNLSAIDFILISNPTSEHFATIKQVVEYNIPLFIEKPLFSEISQETQNLVNEIEEKGTATYVGCNLRFLNALKKLKEILKDTRINEVNVYCGSYLPNWRAGVDFRTIYSANKEMGGGVHIDLIHELDYVYWLFGMPVKTTSFFSNNSSLNITAWDYANYLWNYEGFSASIILNYYRRENKRTIEVVTESGTYMADLLKNTIEFDNKCIFASSQKIADTYYDQMQFFMNSILQNNIQFNTITEANTILGLCMKD